jgi:hypothetical protein
VSLTDQGVVYLDDVLEQLAKMRDQLLADPSVPRRAERLAELFVLEARAWSELFEIASTRVVWRAALAAEAGARGRAVLWQRRAAKSAVKRAATCASTHAPAEVA